jgi:hypothetical protein
MMANTITTRIAFIPLFPPVSLAKPLRPLGTLLWDVWKTKEVVLVRCGVSLKFSDKRVGPSLTLHSRGDQQLTDMTLRVFGGVHQET